MTEPVLPPLFKRFPDLAEKTSFIRLETSVSPVQRLGRLGHDRLWIKRDDAVSSVYGGNKVRRLEWILADVLRQKKKRVITLGGIGTNHGLAMAIFCRRLGLSCTLILFEQPVTSYVLHNLRLFHHFGARLIHAGSMLDAGVAYYFTQRIKDRGAYLIPAGGSSPLGVLGAVNGALELAEQVAAGQCPEPKFVFCPSASNGTVAGLGLGFGLAGLNTRVVGVRVGASRLGPIPLNTPGTVRKMTEKVYSLLRRGSKLVPEMADLPRPLLLEEYCGRGYGHPTAAGNRALEIFRAEENIELDPAYTGKTGAALLDFIQDPARARDPILFWHTFNSVDLSAEAAGVAPHELPPAFHQYFSGPDPGK